MTTLELKGVSVERSGRALISDLDFSASSGEFVALIGPNGAGKTTLLKTALGMLEPARGSVLLDGIPISLLTPRQRAAGLAWLPQQLAWSEPLTVLEVAAAARYRFKESPSTAEKHALTALERVRVRSLANVRVDRLSGGERQRVALAALLAQEARLLLLDEPANHLDPAYQIETYALLGLLRDQGLGVVCVTHDVNLLAHVKGAIRVVGLRDGRSLFDASYETGDLGDKLSDLFRIRVTTLQADAARFFAASADQRGDSGAVS